MYSIFKYLEFTGGRCGGASHIEINTCKYMEGKEFTICKKGGGVYVVVAEAGDTCKFVSSVPADLENDMFGFMCQFNEAFSHFEEWDITIFRSCDNLTLRVRVLNKGGWMTRQCEFSIIEIMSCRSSNSLALLFIAEALVQFKILTSPRHKINTY